MKIHNKVLFISFLFIPCLSYSMNNKGLKGKRIIMVVPIEPSRSYEHVPKGDEVLVTLMESSNKKVVNAMHNETRKCIDQEVGQTLAEIESLKALRRDTPTDQRTTDAYTYLTVKEIVLIEKLIRYECERLRHGQKCLLARFKPYIE